MKKISNKKVSSSSISTIISLSLVLFIIGLLAIFLTNANKMSKSMKESIVFSIMLKNDAMDQINKTDSLLEKFGEDTLNLYLIDLSRLETLSQMQNKSLNINECQGFYKWRFENYLRGKPWFKEIVFVHKDTATRQLEKDLGEDFSSVLESSPLLHSFDANVNSKYVAKDSLQKITETIKKWDSKNNRVSIVQEIFYQENLVEKLENNVRKISLILLVFCVIFFLISFALINNTIRLAVYSKRLLIRTMRLVGATNVFIQKPYLINSIYQGCYSAMIAIFMIVGSIEMIIKKQLPGFIHSNDYLNIGIIFALMLIFGVIISSMSTFFAVRRYLNLNENELYN